ncbi:nuclear pore complex protein Nup88 isoform X1 [Maniola jurtina]|uniref:nuclear pore complex protein Nup88 isoform X1 n=1 Tax=Maniola jurtina TaxID=191418 RepID=UPI001E68642E|nr:nuclear pore complex protein Nup88 isoform X1 [Maniola jurtina]XP_045770946.1 nuclear pore complex protein Nup88 isoform X1 [Maniola jurtina]
MDCRLYETKLARHKIFKDIKESLHVSDAKLRNLFEFKDDVLYVWNSDENCLYSVNLKRLEEQDTETPYQKLHLLTPPAFSVEHVISSECGSRLCIWGSRGVTVAVLPTRWGRGGLFDSGSQTVLCKSFSLDEKFLYLQGEIHRVHWHPKSLSHVLVLVSDNTMRLYNIGLKSGPKLVKVFSMGPKPAGALGRTVLESFGDAAVDFTPTPDSEHLLILSGNGDVYMMPCDLDNKSPLKTKLKGPLAMYPPADDNYGSESCAITALGGVDIPTLVVIASASAVLYHCLLLPNATEVDDDSHALYVVESVELNITMGDEQTALQYVCSVHLYPVGRNTYACAHSGGVHTVTLPVLERLADYVAADEGDTESILQAICTKPSSARYLLRTSGESSRVVGLAVTPAPLRTLLILLSSGDLITRTLEPCNLEDQLYKELQLKNPTLEQDDINAILKEKQKLPFISMIKEVLERQASQPILKLDKKEEPSPKECLELLTQATVKLRNEYILRQQRALEVTTRKIAALSALGAQHRDWLADLKKEIENVHHQSTVLKQKRALVEKRQEDMKYRCSAVVRNLRAGGSTGEERRLLAELLQHQRRAVALGDQIRLLKELKEQQQDELRRWREEYKKKQTVLGKSHSDTIWSILQQQTSQISSLIEETKLLKDQLGVV